MAPEEIWTETIDSVSKGMICGHSTSQLDGRVKHWTKLESPLWITRPIRERWDILGFGAVPTSKLIEFEELTIEHLKESIDYAVYAAGEGRPDIHELVMNWILGSIAEIMNERKIKGQLDLVCPATNLNEFLGAMLDGKFNKSMAKDAFRTFIVDLDLNSLINNDKYKLADQNVITSAIEAVVSDNAEQFEKAKSDPKLVNWLVGQVMKAVAGKAKAPDVREALLAKLNS